MPVTGSIPLEPLAAARIHDLLSLSGPCLTLLLPPHHPGDGSGTTVIVLRTLLREAAEQLEKRRVPQSILVELLAPLEGLANDPGLLAGSHSSRVILRCPDLLEQFQLTAPCSASVSVAGSFSIRRFFPELTFPRQFYVLTLSRESVSLSRSSAMGIDAVELPVGIPATIEEALELEPPDYPGAGREIRQTHVADYYRLVDRGVQKLMHDPEIPLLLAGVDEDTVLYRSVSTCRSLAGESIHRNGKLRLHGTDLMAQALSILDSERVQREARSFVEDRERAVPSRFLTELDAILLAAFEGRVNHLYVNESGERIGIFERPGYRSWGTEDLLNLAMVQTLRHRGKAFVLPGDRLDGAMVAAGLRY